MKKLIIIVIISAAIVAAWFLIKPQRNADSFKISGTVSGFADSTKLYLEDATPSQKLNIIDSAHIVGGKFTLSGKLGIKTMYVMLTTKDHEDYTFLWIENNDMTFTASKGKFQDAVITGSETQNDEAKLDADIKPITAATDSLNIIAQNDTLNLNSEELAKHFDDLRKREQDVTEAFIQKNPGSIISAENLNTFAAAFGKDRATLLYNSFNPEIKNTVYGKSIAEYLALNRNLKIGDKYADFIQPTPDGKSVKLSDLDGRVILLNFWASWCEPCRNENPALIATYRMYKDKGFSILGVSLDGDKKEWADAIIHDGLEWTNVSDLNGDRCIPVLIYGVTGIPDNFLIGKNGIILARNLHGQALRDKLAELLR